MAGFFFLQHEGYLHLLSSTLRQAISCGFCFIFVIRKRCEAALRWGNLETNYRQRYLLTDADYLNLVNKK
jgi:hypothetical protein